MMTSVFRSQGSPVCLLRMPPQMSTIFSPQRYAQQAPPSSRRLVKLSAKTSRTASKPGLTCPCTTTPLGAVISIGISDRRTGGPRSLLLSGDDEIETDVDPRIG